MEVIVTIRQWQFISLGVLLGLTILGVLYDFAVADRVHNSVTWSGMLRLAFKNHPVNLTALILWVGVAIGHFFLAQYIVVYVPTPCQRCEAHVDESRQDAQ